VGRNGDGNLELFIVDSRDGKTINHRRQISANSDWLDWLSLDHETFRYDARIWQVDAGLPNNEIRAIAQTPDGYLWVGTPTGLARFDGEQFTVFDAKNTPAMPNCSITALCTDREGALWIGTQGGGLFCLKDGTFSHYGQQAGLAGNDLRVICQGRDGALWIGTTTGMSRYKNGKFINYTRKQGLLSEVVTYIYEDRDQDLWIATGGGLNRLRKGGQMDAFAMPNGLPNDSVRAICQDKGGRIWIGSNNGLLWYNWHESGHFYAYHYGLSPTREDEWHESERPHFYAYNSRYGLSDPFVSAICEDREGNFWVGTYSGLNRFREGRFFVELNNEGLPFDRVNALFEDRQGDMWVGSKEGLARLTPKHFSTLDRQHGLNHNDITSVLEDRSGTLWVGTWGGGVDDLKGDTITAYSATNDLASDLILSLCESKDGSLWIGADFDGGLSHLSNGVFTKYTWKDGLINAPIKVLHEDHSGTLWMGTSQGLGRLQGGKFDRFTVQDHLAGDAIRAICDDPQGNLWIGTDTGLSLRRGSQFTNFTVRDGLSDNAITALYVDPEQSLWIGTAAGGLNRYRNGQFTSYTTKQGLFSDEIFEILEDDQGWLWMSCSKGVFRVRKQQLNDLDEEKVSTIACTAYGKSDGMESTQCNGVGKPAGWKARDDRLWFPTSKGLVSVDPKAADMNSLPPAVFIEQLSADKKPVRLAGPNTAASSVDPGKGALLIAPGRGELDFRYTALDLEAPERVHFRYQLEGVDSEWVDAGARRDAHYNNVYPGAYRFHVIACNKDGIWNLNGASLAVEVRPHLWQTWWYQTAVVLLVIGSAGGAARFLAMRRMKRRLAMLEQRNAVERERGRIAKDIHDDLGSSLTRIMLLGERTEEGLAHQEDVGLHVRKIIASARNTVQSLDEIVWAVNPENDTLDGLVMYISHYADEFFENTNIRWRLEVPPKMPDITLPAEVRHDLFLVVKEAFHNTLKHSGASVLRVCVSGEADSITIMIDDNGRGFEGNGAGSARKGNGLQNMRKRIEGLGGRFSVTSTMGQGTQVALTVKLAQRQVTH
jgi:ligand-binding sensor domain-containing protein/signal transduction histidine kinase